MRQIYTNPILYYCLVPVLVAVWPFVLWFRYLPEGTRDLQRWKEYVPQVNAVAAEIVKLEPERLIQGSEKVKEQFDYLTAISRTATKCGMPAGSYPHSTGMISKLSSGQKVQDATVTLKSVNIVQASKFLSTIQIDWPHLECTSIAMTQDKTSKDRWTVKLGLKYFYD